MVERGASARNGWVRRLRCATDRRGQLAELTDEGMAVLRRAAPRHAEQVLTLVFDRLMPEQHTALREISEELLAGLIDPAKTPVQGRLADR
jgi:DNA-binding MarR family transcriptional regulator